MKTMFLALILSSTFSFSSYACSCVGANFRTSDAENAIQKFMEGRLRVAQNQIVGLEQISADGYLTRIQRLVIATFSTGETDEIRSCGYECALDMNTRYKYQVEYLTKDKTCKLNLTVKLESNLSDNGFKSVVIKKQHPVCK